MNLVREGNIQHYFLVRVEGGKGIVKHLMSCITKAWKTHAPIRSQV